MENAIDCYPLAYGEFEISGIERRNNHYAQRIALITSAAFEILFDQNTGKTCTFVSRT
ncbi:hypothetical protein [Parapedobacter deserti]|uniref:hypothetical protein n=1 Tax=Parapedobacter deserti TaxID=1912957 RepID=UPI00366DAC6B